MQGLKVCATEEVEELPVGNMCMEKQESQHLSRTT